MTFNVYKGEYLFELGGRAVPLRGNFDNVARAEKAVGKSVEATAMSAQLMNIPLQETAKMIWALSHNKGSSPYTLETIGEWIYEGGPELKMKAFAVAMALMSGVDPDKLNQEDPEEEIKEEIAQLKEEANPEKKSKTRSKAASTKQ